MCRNGRTTDNKEVKTSSLLISIYRDNNNNKVETSSLSSRTPKPQITKRFTPNNPPKDDMGKEVSLSFLFPCTVR